MKFATRTIALLLIPAMLLTAVACNQNTIAALVSTLGNASAAVAKLEGNTALAEVLTTDTAAAVSAINNWKSGGGSAQIAMQALNIVLGDLNLFPGTSQYAPLIALAVTTAEALIAILAPPAQASAKAQALQRYGNAPQNAAQFRARWNAICASNNALAAATLK